MKKVSLLATALVVGGGASQVEAQNLQGSDTLEEVTVGVLAAAPGHGYSVSPLAYQGGGSGNGETALVNNFTAPSATNFQQVAPMSRKLKCSVVTGNPTASPRGVRIGYDGIALVRAASTFVNGDCEAYSAAASAGLPGGYVWSSGTDAALPLGPTYSIAADKLRVLYFGRDHTNTTNCNSALRQALVGSWNNLFEGAQGETCTQLNHAYRRCDPSGTTDTFRSLLGVPSSVPFCNGTDKQDNDPIRRACDSTWEVCGPGANNLNLPTTSYGTLGVVQPICSEPFQDGGDTYTSLPQNTSTQFCSIGKFSYKPVSLPVLSGQKCPDGTAIKGGNCRVPYLGATAATGNFNCYARTLNKPSGSPSAFDGRTFNLVPRTSTGAIRKNARGTNVAQAAYRAIPACKLASATEQIGCFVANDGGCSEGFAGREVGAVAGTRIVKLASIQSGSATPEASACINPDPTLVIAAADTGTTGYPLGRKLYVNALRNPFDGTGAFAAQQTALFSAFQDRSVVDSVIAAHNFITVPGSGPLPVDAFTASDCAP